jgi:hypothetical protein
MEGRKDIKGRKEGRKEGRNLWKGLCSREGLDLIVEKYC